MACYSPISAWRGGFLKSGKREILFKAPKEQGSSLFQLKLPCGQCIGCRLERSRQWAMRCVHEASLYDRNCFLTLTYADSAALGSRALVLTMKDFQDFMKRLRKRFSDQRIRFFHCGEYGEKFSRPHYHAILFNFDFPDKVFFKSTPRGDKLWRSATLEKLWPFGYSMIGSVTFDSAAYVARYCLKKVTGRNADEHYLDRQSGELRPREYVTMSRRPGIGRGWYDKFKSDIFPRDYAVFDGVKCRPPKFYDGIFELSDPAEYTKLKEARRVKAFKVDPSGIGECGDVRLRVKEEVKLAQLKRLNRNLEVTNDTKGVFNL